MQGPLSQFSPLEFRENGMSTVGSSVPAPLPAVPPQNEEGLGQYLGLVKRRALVILGVAATFFAYSAWKTLNQATQYTGNFQILVEPVNAENANLAFPSGVSGRSSQGASQLDYPTQIAILRSPELLGAVLEELQSTFPNLSYGALASQVNIRRLGETKLLQITYQSDDATRTQAVLDALAQKYLEYSLNERQTYLRQGLQFVDGQLTSLREQLDELQNRLEAFQRRNNFIDPETQSEQISGRISALQTQQQELEQQIAAAQTRMTILQQESGIQVTLEQDPAYQEFLSRIREIDAQIAIELTRFQRNNPAIQNLEQQRENLLPLLEQQAEKYLDTRLAEVTLQLQSLNTQLEAAQQAEANLENQLQIIPALSRQYNNLQKELEITNASLTSFLETRQALQVEAAQREIPWELVEEPVTFPLASNIAKELLTGLLMGLALGGAIAFALDKLDNTYHSTEELKAKVKLPVLGVLPFNQQLFLNEGDDLSGRRRKRKLISRLRVALIRASAKVSKSVSFIALSLLDEYDSSAEFVESLRVIHTNLQTNRNLPAQKAIAISSAVPGDGKSTLALNWAQTAAAMGQRVLLIDGVLRNPELHQILELSNHFGLSNLLSETGEPDEAIQEVGRGAKFYALTAGPAVDNPASLLNSSQAQTLFSHLTQSFDLVIIDTPPMLGLADATIINRYVDGLVLVVRLDKTNKGLLQQTLENLQNLGLSVLGLVINGDKGHNLALREATLGSDFEAVSSYSLQDDVPTFDDIPTVDDIPHVVSNSNSLK